MKLAFIPARGGSKSIPMKNIRPFAGRPLLHWCLQAAVDSCMFDRIVVATDSDDIGKCVRAFARSGVEVYDRDPQNAQDNSSTEAVMMEFIGKQNLKDDDIVVLIQATSPFTTGEDIVSAMRLFESGKYDSLVTCTRLKRFIWNADGQALNYDFRNRPRRQDFAGTLVENGAFYVTRVGALLTTGSRLNGRIAVYEMTDERTFFELDEAIDWIVAERLMQEERL